MGRVILTVGLHLAAMNKSTVDEHLPDCGTKNLTKLYAPKVLSTKLHYYRRMVQEAIIISKTKNFNFSYEYKLSPSWNPVIKNFTSRKST